MRFLCILIFVLPSLAVASEKPNILLIFSDDAGYRDFGFQGSKNFKTPILDDLAKNGAKFDCAYVTASICSPSRAGLITGQYQQKFGYYLNIPRLKKPEVGLPVSLDTFGDYMRKCGYRTAAFGKWHLGYMEQHHPNNQGFDTFTGFIGGLRSFFPMKKSQDINSPYQLQKDNKIETDDKYLTEKLTDAAIEFIVDKDPKPFFIYLAYNAVHTPMQATEADLAKFSHIENKKRRTLAAMTKSLDDNVGRLNKALQESGKAENTITIFLNDNGGAPASTACNFPLKGAKGTHSEGGLRVPMIIHWPGKIKAGTVISNPVISLDLLPTCLAAAGQGFDKEKLDGVNLLPVLTAKESSIPNRPLFWALSREIQTVRFADWKLTRLKLSTGPKYRLYSLKDDPYEKNEISDKFPEKVKELNALLEKWNTTLIDPQFRVDDFRKDKDILKRVKSFDKNQHFD